MQPNKNDNQELDNNQNRSSQDRAALHISKRQVERVYDGGSRYNTPHTTPVSQQASPQQTQEEPQTIRKTNFNQKVINPISSSDHLSGAVEFTPNKDKPKPQTRQINSNPQVNNQGDQWKKYHSAWQNYYQKYYESYYTAAVSQAQKSISKNSQTKPKDEPERVFSEEEKKTRALYDLKQNISDKAKERTHKFRKSKHFFPIVSAIAIVVIFLFLQYHSLIYANIYAFISPGNATAQEIIVSPNSSVSVSKDPRLIIPKLNIDVPVAYGIGYDEASQQKAMENGLAHFAIPGANSKPGQVGNTVLSGHSSNNLFDGGDYKFIFAQLERLEVGDTFYANYEGTRYTYTVTNMTVVESNNVQALILDNSKPMMTLITCTPLGTSERRLLVFAEQVAPDPSSAKPQENNSSSSSKKVEEMPSNSPSFFERLFTWNWS